MARGTHWGVLHPALGSSSPVGADTPQGQTLRDWSVQTPSSALLRIMLPASLFPVLAALTPDFSAHQSRGSLVPY